MPSESKHGWTKKLVIWFLAVAFFGGIVSWLYFGKFTPARQRIFQTFSLPIAFVNWQPVSMRDLAWRLDEGNNAQSANNDQAIFDELIYESKLSLLARSLGLGVSQEEIDADYEARAQAAGQDFSALLAQRGISEQNFKESAIKPEVLKTKVNIWYNSQESLNGQIWQQAQSLLAQLNQGQDFAAVAKADSQDAGSASLGGDMGFINSLSILPELREPVENLNPGETKILPSRLGLHIIQLESKAGGNLHLRQIFLSVPNFNDWLDQQLAKYRVYKLINVR